MQNMKFLTAIFKGKDEEKREITAFASTPKLDRDREIIRANAWQLDDFKKHPVLAISHSYDKLWVGKITEITPTSDGLFFRAVFAKTAAGQECWDLIKSTGIAAFSVGFLPITSENVPIKNLTVAEQKAALAAGLTMEGSVRVYTKVSLLEISIVSVPSNTSATLLSWKSLAKTAALRDALEEITISDSRPSDADLANISPSDINAYLTPELVREGVDKAVRNTVAKVAGEVREVVEIQLLVEKAIRAAVKERVELAVAKIRGRVI